MTKDPVKIVLYAAGFILVAIGLIKMVVIGYYPSEAPLFIGILIVGAICLWVGQKRKVRE